MLNAIQQLIVEERLVEEQVFDARIRLRYKINDALGMDVPPTPDPQTGNAPTPQRASTHANSVEASSSRRSVLRGGEQKPSSRGNSPEWDFVYGDGSIPEPKQNTGPVASNVMAVGDVSRDPTRPIAPYVPPTNPNANGDPFPGLRERPMG